MGLQAANETERRAICALCAVPGVGIATLAVLQRRFGSLAAAAAAGSEQIASTQGVGIAARRFLRDHANLAELADWVLQAAARFGARVLIAQDEAFPRSLRCAPRCTSLLFVRGALGAHRRVALVGSREIDAAGVQLAYGLAFALARAGVEIVSGGARGVDAAAHEGALAAGGSTIAVLGTGIDGVYPPEHRGLFDRIARQGALVSEFCPGVPGQPAQFPRRNRTIAGLSEAVVVVRAGGSSGALHTAREANRLGRPVFGCVGEGPSSEGVRRLVARGKARRLEGAEALLAALELPTACPPASTALAGPTGLNRSSAPEGFLARSLWQLLDEQTPRHVDELAQELNLGSAMALQGLQALVLGGRAEIRPGMFFLRRAIPKPF